MGYAIIHNLTNNQFKIVIVVIRACFLPKYFVHTLIIENKKRFLAVIDYNRPLILCLRLCNIPQSSSKTCFGRLQRVATTEWFGRECHGVLAPWDTLRLHGKVTTCSNTLVCLYFGFLFWTDIINVFTSYFNSFLFIDVSMTLTFSGLASEGRVMIREKACLNDEEQKKKSRKNK